MKKVLFLLVSCALLSVASGVVGVADAVGSIEDQLLERLASDDRRQKRREAEAARDDALPPFELCELLELLMPPAGHPYLYVHWDVFEQMEGVYWRSPEDKLSLPGRQEISGWIKVRTAGKIFTNSLLLGYPHEAPWPVHLAVLERRVYSVTLYTLGWSHMGETSGADFDMAAALAVAPRRLRAERIASRGGDDWTATAYILRAPGRKPVVMEHVVAGDPVETRTYVYYDIAPTRDAIYRELRYNPGR